MNKEINKNINLDYTKKNIIDTKENINIKHNKINHYQENKISNTNTDNEQNVSNKKISKKKCNFEGCNKKITIYNIPCKCKLTFCKNHSFFTNHNCTFDYKKNQKNILTKSNPKVISKSFEEI